MRLFGLYINRNQPQETPTTFAPSDTRDGAMEINASAVGFSNQTLSIDGPIIEDETRLITKYRELAQQTEIDEAIQDIVNEAFAYDEHTAPVEINLDDIDKRVIPDTVKDTIREEFHYILNLMNFRQDCYDRFRDWYIDGRIYYEIVTDKDNQSKGVIALKYIDPRKIRKVKEVIPDNATDRANYVDGQALKTKHRYYYVYNPSGITNAQTGLRIAPDQIAYAPSGYMDRSNRTMLSLLHPAIRPYNQYMNMKNSMVIYYHTRAPERRVFNIEIGGLTPGRANQYMQEVISRHRRKDHYDPNTGAIGESQRVMSMNEDFWFPKRDGRGTDVEVLQGGVNLQEINDVVQNYKDELYRSLRLPLSRYKDGGSAFNLGKSSEISRDELKFSKFIGRIRKKFSVIFDEILGPHLILKGILTIEEWEEIVSEISYDFLQDSHFAELKNAEIWQNRLNNLRDAESFIGTFFSRRWAVETFLQLSEDEWEKMKDEIKKEEGENPPVEDELPPEPEENKMIGNNKGPTLDKDDLDAESTDEST